MDKKQVIKQHAADVMAEYGYFGTTPKMIAARAGIAVGTIYLYFSSKEEILDYLFEEEFTKRKNFLVGINQKEYSLYQKLERFLDFHFAELMENKSVGTVLIQESTNPQLHKLGGIRKFITELPEIFADMLLEAYQKGEIRELDVHFIANVLFHSIRGAVMHVEQGNLHRVYERKEELKRFIWHAIKNN